MNYRCSLGNASPKVAFSSVVPAPDLCAAGVHQNSTRRSCDCSAKVLLGSAPWVLRLSRVLCQEPLNESFFRSLDNICDGTTAFGGRFQHPQRTPPFSSQD
jgi:hypothetical protein